MKLVRWGPRAQERPGILGTDGAVRDMSGWISDICGDTLAAHSLDRLRGIDVSKLPVVPTGTRLGPPVSGSGKFVCIGLNYSDHAAESGVPVPDEPVIFSKATSAITGPNDDVILPKGCLKADWEVELGVVIGTTTQYAPLETALEHVAGYLVVNDLSERHFQMERSGQWIKGKSADTFGPIGPWLATRDEIPNPQALRMTLDVNGRRYQNGSTATMIFPVAMLVSYVSQFMSLQPGDIISTGTPPGVGLGQKPPVWLKPGDEMVLSIEGLGTQRQRVRAFE
jgi:2-keto-4-pentenoate hydratase/2-oxohepta-3-ene-1,7-dioic acid hydratase in catechol pathway